MADSSYTHFGHQVGASVMWLVLGAFVGLCAGYWFRGYVDRDSCYDAGGIWEASGGFCYGARSADS